MESYKFLIDNDFLYIEENGLGTKTRIPMYAVIKLYKSQKRIAKDKYYYMIEIVENPENYNFAIYENEEERDKDFSKLSKLFSDGGYSKIEID